MHKLALLSYVLLTACTAQQPPMHGELPGRTCNASGTERLIGQPGNSQTGAAILRATNSARLRWAPPGYMLTMDYSPSRVTVKLDAAYKVSSINCG